MEDPTSNLTENQRVSADVNTKGNIHMKKIIAAALLGGALISGLTACSGVGGKPISSYTPAVATASATPAPQAEPKFALPAPTDFAFEVVELERSCFGSAGCNVTYTLGGDYVGTATIPSTETFRVLYRIDGADDLKTGYVTWRNGHLYGSFGSNQGFVSVSQGSTLTAVATDVIS